LIIQLGLASNTTTSASSGPIDSKHQPISYVHPTDKRTIAFLQHCILTPVQSTSHP
jgi:hypothetical protein